MRKWDSWCRPVQAKLATISLPFFQNLALEPYIIQVIRMTSKVGVLSSVKQVETLDKVYRCKICRAVFLFVSDVHDHKRMHRHADMSIIPLLDNVK